MADIEHSIRLIIYGIILWLVITLIAPIVTYLLCEGKKQEMKEMGNVLALFYIITFIVVWVKLWWDGTYHFPFTIYTLIGHIIYGVACAIGYKMVLGVLIVKYGDPKG